MRNVSETQNTRSLNPLVQHSSHVIITVYISHHYSLHHYTTAFISIHLIPYNKGPFGTPNGDGHTHQQHRNLIRDTIVSLAQYGLHFQDTDEPVITNILQLLLREHPDYILLEQPHSNKYTDPNIPFTIVGNRLEHIPYTHNHDMHQ